MKGRWYTFWMDYMADDEYFCLCGCSSWYWNFYRVVRKLLTRRRIYER